MLGVGVVGCGYWGPNLVRNFVEAKGSTVIAVSDLRPERLASMRDRYPSIQTTTDYLELLNNPLIDAIAIATPVSTHYPLALQALEAGKHVLVEKPMTTSSQSAQHLIAVAQQRQLVLMVDHTFIYSGAIRKIHQLINSDQLGALLYYDAVRVNLGLFQHDVNVIWDLAIHDLAIMDFVLNSKPYAVSATGISHVPGGHENIAYLTLFYENCLIAHIHVNWLAPVKVRRALIGGSRQMIVYDELEPSEKLKVYDKGIKVNQTSEESVYQMLIDYRTGDMWAPQLDLAEALQTEILHFIDCIETGQAPISDGAAGLRVVKILEAATLSMRQQGQLVKLDALKLSV